MVGITEFLGILLVELFGEVEVGVDLEGERLAEGENLYQLARTHQCGNQVLLTFGRNGISGPNRSKTDLPTSCWFFFR